jgi:hypothetical protein
MVFQIYCVLSVTKTFTLKGVETILRSKCLKLDSVYALSSNVFVTLATQ